VPAGALVHIPRFPATLHARQSIVHAELQQYPSTQFPLTHSPSPLHVVPSTFLHTPLPSHWFDPVQMFVGLLSVWPAATLLQLPDALHTLQALSQADSQHTLSTQKLLKQAPLLLHD